MVSHTVLQPTASSRASQRSLWALDALNFFLADVVGGVGPYLAVYLKSALRWDAGSIGVAMATASVCAVIAQTPAGALVDKTVHKRAVISIAALTIALGAVLLVASPCFPCVIGSQVLIGSASAFLPPAVAAISLGLVGPHQFDKRIGRNEAFNHSGNVAAAAVSGLASKLFSIASIFNVVAILALSSIASVLMIDAKEIDHNLARGSNSGAADAKAPVSGILHTLSDKRILVFAVSAILFHFANAAMLPQVGQKVAESKVMDPGVCMSACIIVAQFCMVPSALLASKFAATLGRKPVFLIGFASLPLRAILFTLTNNPYALIATQVLDGVGAGIYGVLGVVIAADLTRGTGRFNVVQGIVATGLGIGAGLSNLLIGYIVKAGGYNAGFLTLAGISLAAIAFFWLLMPETMHLSDDN
ncbi:MAG TPA: MFS transporter [Drouetiella sp.]|jgi:MFS family permease